MRATEADGRLAILEHCRLTTPYGDVCLRILPEITDSKSATYANEPIIGRTTPMVTYSYSDPRTISTEFIFMITTCSDIEDNLRYKRIIESLVYPGDESANAPYTPPPVSQFKCGQLFAREKDPCDDEDSAEDGVCVILKNYSIRYPTDVAWDAADIGGNTPTYLPYRFSISCSWEVVYACRNLPTSNKIARQTKSWCPIPKGL